MSAVQEKKKTTSSSKKMIVVPWGLLLISGLLLLFFRSYTPDISMNYSSGAFWWLVLVTVNSAVFVSSVLTVILGTPLYIGYLLYTAHQKRSFAASIPTS